MTRITKSQHAYQLIRERIDSGQYVPGYRLVLSALAAEFGVSVVPIREALRRLQAEQLVTFDANIGAHVSLVDELEYQNTMTALMILESYATALAAGFASSEQLARARDLNEQMRANLGNFDPHLFTELNQKFHSELLSSCPNQHLLAMIDQQRNRVRALCRSAFSFAPERACGSVQEHDEILELIASRAPAQEIEAALRRQREKTIAAVVTKIKTNNSQATL